MWLSVQPDYIQWLPSAGQGKKGKPKQLKQEQFHTISHGSTKNIVLYAVWPPRIRSANTQRHNSDNHNPLKHLSHLYLFCHIGLIAMILLHPAGLLLYGRLIACCCYALVYHYGTGPLDNETGPLVHKSNRDRGLLYIFPSSERKYHLKVRQALDSL